MQAGLLTVNLMEYLDITHGISSGMLVYPGDPKVLLRQFRQGPLVTKLTMGLHAGTHVDAPAHYIKGGKTISEVGLGRLNGAARVCDFTDVWLEIDKAQICRLNRERGT
jgi:arylformamidase